MTRTVIMVFGFMTRRIVWIVIIAKSASFVAIAWTVSSVMGRIILRIVPDVPIVSTATTVLDARIVSDVRI